MGRSERPVPDGPLKEFAEGLRSLRKTENLTYRQLSARARYSYSVLSTAASGKALPTLEATLAYVGACNGDTAEWAQRWDYAAAVLRATDADLLPPEALRPTASVGATAPSGRASAVKVIRPQIARDSEFRHRFAGELVAARKVDGDHTAAVLDADAHAERPWMASEYLPGPSLAEVVENQGPLAAPVVLALAAGICEALSAFGTVGFMAPEQAEGREVTPAVDVIALGCVMVYAATGRAPLGGGTRPLVLYRIVHDAPDDEAPACDHDQLRELIKRCLSKEAATTATNAAVEISDGHGRRACGSSRAQSWEALYLDPSHGVDPAAPALSRVPDS